MEKEIKELLNKQVLQEAAYRFGVNVDALSFIGGFQNFVFEYLKSNKPYILRLTHSSHRDVNLVRGELDWILYLVDNGISASKPILSNLGKFTEIISVGDSYFIATLFEKAEGRKIGYPECLNNDELSYACGEFTGRIHSLSKKYVPSTIAIKRYDWTANYYLRNIRRFIPSNQPLVLELYDNLFNQISGLRKEQENYGLIHGDINVGNFFIDNGQITLFDFDECQYSWFVEDIAIQLFYMVYVYLDDSINEREVQAKRFMEHFLNGYCCESSIDGYSLNQLSLFLQLRELIVYIGMYRSSDFSNLGQWQSNYILESRRRLENGIPIVEGIY